LFALEDDQLNQRNRNSQSDHGVQGVRNDLSEEANETVTERSMGARSKQLEEADRPSVQNISNTTISGKSENQLKQKITEFLLSNTYKQPSDQSLPTVAISGFNVPLRVGTTREGKEGYETIVEKIMGKNPGILNKIATVERAIGEIDLEREEVQSTIEGLSQRNVSSRQRLEIENLKREDQRIEGQLVGSWRAVRRDS
jgi:hypothetical protein